MPQYNNNNSDDVIYPCGSIEVNKTYPVQDKSAKANFLFMTKLNDQNRFSIYDQNG